MSETKTPKKIFYEINDKLTDQLSNTITDTIQNYNARRSMSATYHKRKGSEAPPSDFFEMFNFSA